MCTFACPLDRIGNRGVEQNVAGGVGYTGEDMADFAQVFAIAIIAFAIGGLRQAGKRSDRAVDKPQDFTEGDRVGGLQQ
ncbi:hypothetical protein D3C86_2034200 [compost metagenome]